MEDFGNALATVIVRLPALRDLRPDEVRRHSFEFARTQPCAHLTNRTMAQVP